VITEIDTVPLYVADQRRARDFYVDVLGFEVTADADLDDLGRWIEIAPPGAHTALVLLAAEAFGGKGTGKSPEVTLACPDVQALHAELTAKGVPVTEPESQSWGTFVKVTDPDGNELVISRRGGRTPADEFAEFTTFKREFEQASRDKDRDAIERMVHSDFSMVTPQGDVVSRKGVIAGITSSGATFMPHYQRQERTISFSAGRDIVREIADVHVGGEIPGRGEITGDYTHSAVFVRGEHGWQFFGNTLTRKTKPE
jgi:lactoylglutathione lyase